jgi:DNA repair photolyase
MKVIYEPRGRAKEYSPLAVNLYKGCVHGCRYCYAPACLRQTRETFHANVTPRSGILQAIDRDLKAIAPNNGNLFATSVQKTQDRVLFCFTSDPYQGDNRLNQITRQALKLFRQYGVPFQVLTKGGMKAVRDFDLYSQYDAFACTLTFSDEERSKEWEPEAAFPQSRIQALQEAKKRGIETWVSFEPVLDAESVFSLLDATHEFVDLYKVGKCSGNFSSIQDWNRFGHEVIERLEKLGKNYYIKNDLKKCL